MDSITSSEAWMQGFVKAAVDAGLSKEDTQRLYKVAVHTQSSNREAYMEGFNNVIKQAFAPQGNTLFGTIRDVLTGSPYQPKYREDTNNYFNTQVRNLGQNAMLSNEDRYAMLSNLLRNRKHNLQSQLASLDV